MASVTGEITVTVGPKYLKLAKAISAKGRCRDRVVENSSKRVNTASFLFVSFSPAL
jgi:hypothetical protein